MNCFSSQLLREILSFRMIRVVRGRSTEFRLSDPVRGNENGQVLLIGLFCIIGMTMISISVANIGIMVSEKIHLQDTVDAAAYSSAVVEARYMNLSAYINRAMMANYSSMAFNTALWATVDAYDHGLAIIADLLYKVSFALIWLPPAANAVDTVADAISSVHELFHTVNQKLNDWFAQDEQDFNKYIEYFNIDILTIYQGLLYAATQSIRHQVQKEVALKMDDEVITTTMLGLGAETASYDELAKAVDFVIRDPEARTEPWERLNEVFDLMHGEAEDTLQHPFLLAATTEASLDKFSAGWDRAGEKDMLRQFDPIGNIFPMPAALTVAMWTACKASCLIFFCSCNPRVTLSIGPSVRQGEENDADEARVPIIARQRMREVNMFGLNFRVQDGGWIGDAISGIVGRHGHTSGDVYNDVGNVANLLIPTMFTDPGRAAQCLATGASGAVFTPVRGLNTLNILAAQTMFTAPMVGAVDDHWDGTLDSTPDDSWEIIPPGAGIADAWDYLLTSLTSWDLEDGVPKYDWQVDLDNVGFPLYTYPEEGATERPEGTNGGGENNLLTGPSIAVAGVKPREKINGLIGLGIGNDYSMTAIARAQVYYLRNPNRPKEHPSTFNPYWVARLAPIDSDDTPPLLRRGIPFLSSTGITVVPTH